MMDANDRSGGVRTDASAPPFRTPDTGEQAVELVVRIAEKARGQGVASLREDAERADNELLRHGLQLLAEGANATSLQAAMGREITDATAANGGAFMARRVLAAGLGMIGDGTDPDIIRRDLRELLPPS